MNCLINTKKRQVLIRMLQDRKLLEKGFNATLIETEDIHVSRRSLDDVANSKIKQCSKILKKFGRYYPPELQRAIDSKIQGLLEKTQRVIEKSKIPKKRIKRRRKCD